MLEGRIVLIIPTLNGGEQFHKLLASMSLQQLPLYRKIVIDSSSTDDTAQRAKQFGFEVVSISRDEFNHGLTRQRAAAMVPEADVVVFLTQDVILADELAMGHLVDSFADVNVGAAYGRQLPHKGAMPLEAYARLCNYPSESRIKSLADAAELGIKTAFMSNSFAAYRCSALKAVGGFPSNTILGEDMYVAAKMILAGWKIAYCAEAKVYHSHKYSLTQEYKRYFDIGVFQSREAWIRERFGQAEGQGLRYVISELNYLWDHHYKHMIPGALVRTVIKYLGYKMGLSEAKIPLSIKKHLSMHARYWKRID